MFSRLYLLFVGLLILSGCTTTEIVDGQKSDSEYDYSTLYLRGSFSWWEAEEAYKVVKVSDSEFKVVVDLVADGQPYDFKFADKNWTNGLSCGYRDKDRDEEIVLGRSASVNCFTPVDNFKFLPDESGKYMFTLDFSGWGDPKLTVVKL